MKGSLSSVHTELLAIAMQKWVENFAKEFLAMPANAQYERTFTLRRRYRFALTRDKKQHETQVGMLHLIT